MAVAVLRAARTIWQITFARADPPWPNPPEDK